MLDLQDLKQCNSIQNLDIIFNFESENNETTELIYKNDLGSTDFNKPIIIPTDIIQNNHNNNCTTMIIFLHIKGENNQNSFNLTLIDNAILKRNQEGTLTFTTRDFCATNPVMALENLTTMAPTTILESSHLDTNKVEGKALQY